MTIKYAWEQLPLRWHGSLSAKVNKNTILGYSHDRGQSQFQGWRFLQGNLSLPNFFKIGFQQLINIFINPKLPLDGRIYTVTVGRVLNTNVFQINIGELLFRATPKVRLGSCLSTALKMDNLDCTKINPHFKKFTACLREGLIHECQHTLPIKFE